MNVELTFNVPQTRINTGVFSVLTFFGEIC